MKTRFYSLIVIQALAGVVWANDTPRTDLKAVETKLNGTWVGVSGHWGRENPPPETRSFTFMSNHQFQATIAGTTVVGNYRIDTTKEPFQIDFTFEYKDGKGTTLTIIDFPEENHIRIAEWDPHWRRKEFAPGITFKKKESSSKAANQVPEDTARKLADPQH